jgi:hypothetical protein
MRTKSLERTAAGRRSCKQRALWPPSLSSGVDTMNVLLELDRVLTNARQSVRAARLWFRQRELRRLLSCEELRVVEAEVTRRLSLPLLPSGPIEGSVVDNWLRFAGLSYDEAREWLSRERERLVAFIVAINREFQNDDRDGEFPEGEEPDPADKSQLDSVLGYSNGGALTTLCWYVLLKQKSPEALAAFLQKTRMPHRQQLAERLRVVYDATL